MVERLSTADLAQRCNEETARYTRHEAHDPQFCFELLRRALAEHDTDAFEAVYHAYERRVTGWVLYHGAFHATHEDAEFFVGAAFRAFYFALSGEKFSHFSTLAAILEYLKVCVHTSIVQYLRDISIDTDPLPPDHTPDDAPSPTSGLVAREVWERMYKLLPNERDRLLARCKFVEDLRPREMILAYPAIWNSEREITVALYRIRRILRADMQLQELLS